MFELSSTYSLSNPGGRPTILRNGQPITAPSYCSCGPTWREGWLTDHRLFAEHGREIYWLTDAGGVDGNWSTTAFWRAPGRIEPEPSGLAPNYFGVKEQATEILNFCSTARFFVRMNDMPPGTWGQVLPESMQTTEDGKRMDMPSVASERYLSELNAYIRAFVSYCERQPWADRIIGYVMFPLGEGMSKLSIEGWLFDHSAAMQDAFRAAMRGKYSTDHEIQRSWGDPAVTLEQVQVPRENDFRLRTPNLPFWPEARFVRRERDYFEFQEQLFRRYLSLISKAIRGELPSPRVVGIDALKGNMSGWMCASTFTGTGWKPHAGDWILSTGSGGMGEILDEGYFDMLVTPHDYRCRWVGFGFSPEGIGDSVTLRGKLMLIEEDQRTWVNNERGLFGSPDQEETECVFQRNAAAALTRGQQTYAMDVCGGYFRDESVQTILQRRSSWESRMLASPRNEVGSVVMLLDDRAAKFTDFSSAFTDLAVIRQRICGLDHCGVPSRIHLLEDIDRADFPQCHRLFILPNCFLSSPARRALIQEKLFRDGNVVVFGPGSGITDGETVAPEHASALLGIDFELYDYAFPRFVTIDNFSHPVTAGAGACEVYGDTLIYGPMLVPWNRNSAECTGGATPRKARAAGEGGFTTLGSIGLDCGKRRPGLVVKEFGKGAAGNGSAGRRGSGDYAVVFTAALPLPARILRELARWSGTHVWNEEDDVLFADATTVALHAVKPGPRVIQLPGSYAVADLTLGEGNPFITSELKINVVKPVTHVFSLGLV